MSFNPPEPPREAPNDVVGDVVSSVLNIPKQISETISQPIDRGPLGEYGPHRSVDALVKSISDGLDAINKGITKAFDQPIEEIRYSRRRVT